MDENPKPVESEVIKNFRTWVTKNGTIKKDKLRPIIFHDNRNSGTYCIGKNAAKRAKREKENGEGK